MIFEKSDKLLMIGDSITDAGRSQPVGEGLFNALGTGYVAYVDALLNSAYPELAVRVVNMGLSGNRVRDLAARWQADVLALKPDWVTVMIGINDVWRQFDMIWQTEEHVLPDEYRKTLNKLVDDTLPHVKGLFLATPYYIESHHSDAMRARMDQYGELVKGIGAAKGVKVIDTQAAFDKILKHLYPATLAWDRVHPNAIGNMVISRAFLDAFGFDWHHKPGK